jgi:hypothetical protein
MQDGSSRQFQDEQIGLRTFSCARRAMERYGGPAQARMTTLAIGNPRKGPMWEGIEVPYRLK